MLVGHLSSLFLIQGLLQVCRNLSSQDALQGYLNACMGAGVEGVMRKCCEETLRVLRVHKESLLTIVEVFIHDPLYRWALTPANAQQRQVSSLGDASSQGEPPDPPTPPGCLARFGHGL